MTAKRASYSIVREPAIPSHETSCKHLPTLVTQSNKRSRNRAPMLAATQPPTRTHPCPHMPIKMPTHIAQRSACALHEDTGGSIRQGFVSNWNTPFSSLSPSIHNCNCPAPAIHNLRVLGNPIPACWSWNDKWMQKDKKDSEKKQTTVWSMSGPTEDSRAPPVVSQVLRINPNSLRHHNKETRASNELHKARYSHPGCLWLVESAYTGSLSACFHFMRYVLDVSGLQILQTAVFCALPLQYQSASTITDLSSIPYDGHQVWQATSTTEKCVGFLPPGSIQGPPKTFQNECPCIIYWYLLVKTVTNNLPHHTIQNL